MRRKLNGCARGVNGAEILHGFVEALAPGSVSMFIGKNEN
jgi:hypothetical protein